MAGVGAVITTGAGLVTVNVAVAVLVSHLSVAVNVTVTLPPVHRSGAVDCHWQVLVHNRHSYSLSLTTFGKAASSAAWSA